MHMRYSWIQQLIIIVVVITTVRPAQAEPKQQQTVRAARSVKPVAKPPDATQCDDKRPWYCGVSTEDRKRAIELYSQANQLFDDALFTAAETKYRAALVFWKHPSIHYNLMLALVALEQPIEAYKASIEALRYGIKALKPEEYRRAMDYQTLLRGRIASLTITCDEPGAVVSLNGKDILHGPNTAQLLVLPGKHELVARKEGYLTTHHSLDVVAQKPTVVQMRLLPQEMALLPVRRWPAWKPWALTGMGLGVGLAGGLLEWRADINNRLLRKLVAEVCSKDPDMGHDMDGPLGPGCSPDDDNRSKIHERQARYTWYRRLGHGASLVGSLGVISGLALVYLNREQQIENPIRRSLIQVSAAPYITPEAQGVLLNLSF